MFNLSAWSSLCLEDQRLVNVISCPSDARSTSESSKASKLSHTQGSCGQPVLHGGSLGG